MILKSEGRFGVYQRLTGVSMLVFAGALLVSDVLDPTAGNAGDARLDVASAATHSGRALATAVLLLASTVAVLPAVAGLCHLARRRRRVLADTGAGLAAMGALGHAALVTFYGFLLEMPAGDRTQMAALLDRVNSGVVLLLVFPLLLCLGVGLILLTAALWRARVAPLWCFIAMCVVFPLDFFGPPPVCQGGVRQLR